MRSQHFAASDLRLVLIPAASEEHLFSFPGLASNAVNSRLVRNTALAEGCGRVEKLARKREP